MIIACIGDSLTEGDYGIFGKSGIANVKEENYPYFLSGILNAEVRNFGKSGYTSTTYLEFYKSGEVFVKGADYIIIMLGTNGGLDPVNETQGNKDFDEIINLCKVDEPNARIVLCTPPHVTENPEYSNCGYAPQVKNAVGFVRKYAKENKLDIIETALCPDFTAETEGVMQPNDGLHFGKQGYIKLAEYIASELNKL